MDNNYYQTVVFKIKELVAKNDLLKALSILDEELSLPYIPKNYYQLFLNLKFEIEQELKVFNEHNNHWSLAKIEDTLTNFIDGEAIVSALEQLKNYNVRLILKTIKLFLQKNEIENSLKTEVLLILKEQGINEKVTVVKTHGTFFVIPTKIDDIWNNKIYCKISETLKVYVSYDNPSLHQLCLVILNDYLLSLLPAVLPEKDQKEIASAIYYHACSLQMIKVTLKTSAKLFNSNIIKSKFYCADLAKQISFIK